MKRLVPVFLILLVFLCPVQAQEQPSVSDQEARQTLESFFMRIFRLVTASAYMDPPLLLQELDGVEAGFPQLEKVAAVRPDLQLDAKQLGSLKNIMKMFRLYPLSEFGLLDEFRQISEPLIEKSEEASHRVVVLMMGFRTARNLNRVEDAAYFLKRAEKEIATGSKDIDQVNRFTVATARVIQEQAEGATFTPTQLKQRFRSAWAVFDGYDKNADMSSNVSWFHGRHAVRFWLEQLAPEEMQATPELKQIGVALDQWSDNIKVEDTGDFGDIDSIQGAITLYLSTIDLYLTVFEVKPELLKPEILPTLIENFDQRFAAVDKITTVIEAELNLPGMPDFRVGQTTFLKELRLRYQLLKSADQRISLQERQQSLSALASGFEELYLPETYILNHVRYGHALANLQQPNKALQAWERAFNKADDLAYRAYSTEIAQLLAREHGNQGNWDKSSFYAAQVSESLQADLTQSQFGELNSRTRSAANDEASAHLKSSRPEQALVALDRASQLTAAAAQLEGDPQAKSAVKELAESEQQVAAVKRNVASLKRMPASTARDQMLEGAEKLLADTRADFLSRSREIRGRFPQLYSSTLRFDPLNLAEIQGSLPADAVVVQYFPTAEGLYIFVVDKKRFRLRLVEINSLKLDQLAIRFHRSIQQNSSTEAKLAKILYGHLISPIDPDIQGAKQLILIPTGKLNLLPFSALQDQKGQRLVQKASLVQLAKTTDFMRIATSKIEGIQKVTAFTNATLDLPAAAVEGREILKLFPGSQQFDGTEANLANLQQFGSKSDVLHLATHGTWDAGNSLRNHLKLANGEELAQKDIFSLDLSDTAVVTLSACSTALGDSEKVGYVASLAEAFWLAGTHTVIASLWPVEDNSTGQLMTGFYGGLKSGLGRSESLREAQLALLKTPKYQHPYYWSGFVVFGDYR